METSGQKIRLKDFKGRVVILHFWATWCKPCKEEFPAFEKLYPYMKETGVIFLPIAIDVNAAVDEIRTFAKGLGASFPVYAAKGGDVSDRYWTWGVPETYFINKKGFIVARALGPRDWVSENVKQLINELTEERCIMGGIM